MLRARTITGRDLGLRGTTKLKEPIVRASNRLEEVRHCVWTHSVVLDAGSGVGLLHLDLCMFADLQAQPVQYYKELPEGFDLGVLFEDSAQGGDREITQLKKIVSTFEGQF